MPRIVIDKDSIDQLDFGTEWIETNGLGAYACSTIYGCNTRKYHGLLVSPVEGTAQRFLFLSRIEITLFTDTGEYKLSTNQYPGTLHPAGYRYEAKFVLDETPHYQFESDQWQLDYRVAMRYEHPAVLIGFRSTNAKGMELLKIQPILAYRDFNATCTENGYIDAVARPTEGIYLFSPYEGLPPISFGGSEEMKFTAESDWYRSNEYLREMERGYDFREDLFSPGHFLIEMRPEAEFVFQAALGIPKEKPKEAFETEIKRRKNRKSNEGILEQGANHFIITKKRAGKASIIAGFPWFGEWGRDAMIALPGLTLCRGEPEVAVEILETFASFERNGLFPNQLDVHGRSSYNTVDASLWFFWAAQMLVIYTGDQKVLSALIRKTMRNILSAYVTGQVPHGKVRDDGLLDVGNEDTQLTWMDARVFGKPVTPRFGRPVEINALWINALEFYAELVENAYSYELAPLQKLHRSVAGTFSDTFWLEEYGYLADVVFPDNVIDASIRPNQIFAVSLPNSALSADQAKRIVDTVEKHLLTPYGLRTLTPTHTKYQGKYEGNQESRDSAYHQGTVWPWLIGHFVEAYLKVYSDNRNRLEDLQLRLIPLFESHPYVAGLGSVSEIFDGDEPHRPGGCPMQAWSVAEVIRASKLLDEHLQ